MSLRTHMDKHPKSGVYRYRKGVPAELRPYLPAPHTGKREIIATLGTKDPKEAKRIHSIKSEEFERSIFDVARAAYEAATRNANPLYVPSGYAAALRAIAEEESINFSPPDLTSAYSTLGANFQPTNPQPSSLAPTQHVANKDGSPTIATILDEYFKEANPASETEREARRAWKVLMELNDLTEEHPITAITKAHIRSFKQTLLEYPNVKSAPRPVRSMSAKDVLAWKAKRDAEEAAKGKDEPKNPVVIISRSTAKKWLSHLSAPLKMSEQNHDTPDPTANMLKLSFSKADRPGYDSADLQNIFTHEHFNKPWGEEQWLPLIALYTGARAGEIAFLLKTDVRQEDGIHYLHVQKVDEEGNIVKSTKNDNSIRMVPIHPDLIRLGLMDYVTSCGDALFPVVGASKSTLRNFSQRWGRMREAFNIKDRRKVFHSFRHTFKTACRKAGVTEEIHDALTGHSNKSVGRSYGEYPLSVLKEAMDRVTYNLPF